jgi:hypothetical protein
MAAAIMTIRHTAAAAIQMRPFAARLAGSILHRARSASSEAPRMESISPMTDSRDIPALVEKRAVQSLLHPAGPRPGRCPPLPAPRPALWLAPRDVLRGCSAPALRYEHVELTRRWDSSLFNGVFEYMPANAAAHRVMRPHLVRGAEPEPGTAVGALDYDHGGVLPVSA